MNKVIKIAVEFEDGTKQVLWSATEKKEQGIEVILPSGPKMPFLTELASLADEYAIPVYTGTAIDELVERVESKIKLATPTPPTFKGVTAHLIKIDSEKPSHKGGIYQRHYFRNAANQNEVFIMDLTKSSSAVFKKLNVGDVLTNLSTFKWNEKMYINGKSKAEVVGQWGNIKHLFSKFKGITL